MQLGSWFVACPVCESRTITNFLGWTVQFVSLLHDRTTPSWQSHQNGWGAPDDCLLTTLHVWWGLDLKVQVTAPQKKKHVFCETGMGSGGSEEKTLCKLQHKNCREPPSHPHLHLILIYSSVQTGFRRSESQPLIEDAVSETGMTIDGERLGLVQGPWTRWLWNWTELEVPLEQKWFRWHPEGAEHCSWHTWYHLEVR